MKRKKTHTTKSVLRLPDPEHATAAVLHSLTGLDAQRGYRQILDGELSSPGSRQNGDPATSCGNRGQD